MTTSTAPTPPSSNPRPVVDAALAARLRAAFTAADFTSDGCLDLLGAGAYAALARSETVPALRATGGGSARSPARRPSRPACRSRTASRTAG